MKKLLVLIFICYAASTGFVSESSTAPPAAAGDSYTELQTMMSDLQLQVSALQAMIQSHKIVDLAQACQQIGGFSAASAPLPEDCTEIFESGTNTSGVYTVRPQGETESVEVFCDMITAGGGWTLIQRRQDGSEEFFRPYTDYETGFGNVTSEHWLGNKHIHAITKQAKYELLVELLDFKQVYKYAHYTSFAVDDAASNYTLHVDGYNGTAGDSLKFDHDGQQFSTADADHDGADVNCAQKHHGGYWYSNCFKNNINGKWGVAGEQGIVWGSFKDWTMYVLKRTEMKIRRVK